jgi:hypothetical protein
MKYLKRFNINESIKKIIGPNEIDDIKDCLLHFNDSGYDPSVTFSRNLLIIRIVIYTDEPLEINKEVKEEFDRLYNLISYLIDDFEFKAQYVEKAGNSIIRMEYNDFIKQEKLSVRNLLFILNT